MIFFFGRSSGGSSKVFGFDDGNYDRQEINEFAKDSHFSYDLLKAVIFFGGWWRPNRLSLIGTERAASNVRAAAMGKVTTIETFDIPDSGHAPPRKGLITSPRSITANLFYRTRT